MRSGWCSRMVRNHSYAWGWRFSHIIKMRKWKMFCFTSAALNSLRGSAQDSRGMTTPWAYFRYALSHTRHSQHQYKWLDIVFATKWSLLIYFQSFIHFSLQYQMGHHLSYTYHKCPKPYWIISSLPYYILSLDSCLWLLGNRLTDTTHLSPQYIFHTKLCPITSQTFLASTSLTILQTSVVQFMTNAFVRRSNCHFKRNSHFLYQVFCDLLHCSNGS